MWAIIAVVRGGKRDDGLLLRSGAGGDGCQRLKQCYNSRMAFLNSPTEWCPAPIIGCVGVDVVPFEQDFHHSLVPVRSSKAEWCFPNVVRLFGVDVVPSE